MAETSQPLFSGLWVMHGPNWSLPVEVQWETDVDAVGRVRVHPGAELTGQMRKSLSAKLDGLATNHDGEWRFIPAQTFLKHADPLEDWNPDQCVSWSSPSGRRLHFGPRWQDEWISYLAATGYFKSKTEARLLWHITCAAMLGWLTGRRSLSLGFLDLVCLPFRPSWRELVHNWTGGREPWWNDAEVKQQLQDDRLTLWSAEGKVLLWTLTVHHRAPWWRAMIAAEKLRAGVAGRKRVAIYYLHDVQLAVVDRLHDACAALGAWWKEAHHSYLRISALRWGIHENKLRPWAKARLPQPPVFPGFPCDGPGPSGQPKDGEPKNLESPDAGLSPVPDLPQLPAVIQKPAGAPDLRHAGDALGESETGN